MKKILAIALLLMAAMTGCTQIDTGNVGVETVRGQVSDQTMPPGVYGTIFKTVYEVTTKQVVLPLNDLKPKTKDNLTMADFDIDVYYSTNGGKVASLFTKYNGDLAKLESGDLAVGQGRVYRTAREAAYQVASEFAGLEMNQKRGDMAAKLIKYIQAELDRNDAGAFVVQDVNIRSLVTDAAIEQSNRANAQMQNEIDQKEKQIQLARKEAERLKVIAQGEADANQIVSASLTDRLVELKRIEAQAAFAKAGTHTVLMQGGATPLVQVK